MPDLRLRSVPALLAAAVLALAPSLHAQGSTTSPGSDAPSPEERAAIQPPEALEPIVPEYPAQALAGGVEAGVVLRLGIAADGVVTEAEVMEPVGHGFDEAARAAALRVRFRPARRGERAVASRVLVRVDFRLPAAALSPPESEAASVAAPRAVAPTPTGTLPPAPRAEPVARASEVTVHGVSDAEKRRQSAEAVTVIETEQAQRESSDTGRVLARTQGVGVRRAGGLGSTTRFSLNGLTDDHVRFFLDGVPLELTLALTAFAVSFR